jgi:hypothetical protein
MSFEFIKTVNGLKMFIEKDGAGYCIIVDDDTVLFEISADCNQNAGYLEDASN